MNIRRIKLVDIFGILIIPIIGGIISILGVLVIASMINGHKVSGRDIIYNAPSNPVTKKIYTDCLENKLKTEKYITLGNVWSCQSKADSARPIKQTEALKRLKSSN